MKRKLSSILPICLAIAALAIAAASHLSAEGPGVYALRDARIVRVSGPVIEHGTILVRDGLIEAVGDNITPPADAWVVDCKGLTVYPGLVDALSNWGLTNTPATTAAPAAGGRGGGRAQAAIVATPNATATVVITSTPARGPEDRPSNVAYNKAADQLFPTDRNIESARNGGYTAAVTFATGNIFAGQGSVISLAGERAGDMVIVPSVGQMITLGGGRGGGGGGGYPGSLMGSIAYIRQIYLDADHYKLAKSIYEKHPQGLPRPAYDRTLEGVIATDRVLLPAERSVEIERMIAFAKEMKMNAVLYGGHEAWRDTDLLKKTNTPILVSLKYPVKAADSDPALDEPLRTLELREKAPTAAGALAKAGVKFAFYSDGVSTPRDLMRAVKKAIDAGLSPADAIRALTLSPAEIFGVDNRLGSIDKGKIADLVVVDGDIFAGAKVKYVFVDGNKFEPPDEPAGGGRGGRGGATIPGLNQGGSAQ